MIKRSFVLQWSCSSLTLNWRLLHIEPESISWVVLRSQLTALTEVIDKGHALVAKSVGKWVALVPITPVLMLVYEIGDDQTNKNVVGDIERHPIPQHSGRSKSPKDPWAPLSMIPWVASDLALSPISSIQDMIRSDVESASTRALPDSAAPLPPLRACTEDAAGVVVDVQDHETVSTLHDDVDEVDDVVICSVQRWYRLLIKGKSPLENASRY